MTSVIQDLQSRGLIAQTTDAEALDALLNEQKIALYCGFDPTADSPRPLQNPHLRRISALCAARSFAYLYDMSALAALLRLELRPHLRVLQRSQPA